MEITCPYCLNSFKDDEVLFRSRIYFSESQFQSAMPKGFSSIEDVENIYKLADRENVLTRLRYMDFYREQSHDEVYDRWWSERGGETTEYDPRDDGENSSNYVKIYRRKLIDPKSKIHCQYLVSQGNDYFLREDNMVVGIVEQFDSGAKWNKSRVCPHCHNPLPRNYGKYPVKYISVIGITGSGKTVYLSRLLDTMPEILSKLGFDFDGTNDEVFISKNLVASGRPLPGPTPPGQFQQPLTFDLIRAVGGFQKVETFVLYDIAGEFFNHDGNQDSEDADDLATFAPYLTRSDGIMILIDPLQFEGIASAEEVKSDLNSIIVSIKSLLPVNEKNELYDNAVAICISKADCREVLHAFTESRSFNSEQMHILRDGVRSVTNEAGIPLSRFDGKSYNAISEGITNFIKKNNRSFYSRMNQNFKKYNFFAFSALGDCNVIEENGIKTPSCDAPPCRIEEPLFWLFHQFGYIDSNERIYDPRPLACPHCGSFDYEKGEFIKRQGIFKKSKYSYKCKKCDELFNNTQELLYSRAGIMSNQ